MFGSLTHRLFPVAVITGSTSLLIKDYLLYGREDETDRTIRKLVQKDGIFFDIPNLTSDKYGNWEGCAKFGKKNGVRYSLPKHQVKVNFKTKKIQSDNLDPLSEFEFDAKTLETLNAYCVKTLKKMNNQSFLSFLLGFRPISEKIMIESAFHQ